MKSNLYLPLAPEYWPLSLFLLVLHVRANDAYDAFATHDLAILTDSTDAASYFHDFHLKSRFQTLKSGFPDRRIVYNNRDFNNLKRS